MRRAKVYLKSGKEVDVTYRADDVEDIFTELEKPDGVVSFDNCTVYARSIDAIEWLE